MTDETPNAEPSEDTEAHKRAAAEDVEAHKRAADDDVEAHKLFATGREEVRAGRGQEVLRRLGGPAAPAPPSYGPSAARRLARMVRDQPDEPAGLIVTH